MFELLTVLSHYRLYILLNLSQLIGVSPSLISNTMWEGKGQIETLDEGISSRSHFVSLLSFLSDSFNCINFVVNVCSYLGVCVCVPLIHLDAMLRLIYINDALYISFNFSSRSRTLISIATLWLLMLLIDISQQYT